MILDTDWRNSREIETLIAQRTIKRRKLLNYIHIGVFYILMHVKTLVQTMT